MTSDNPDLKGIGGWLAAFIIIIGVISPVRMLVETGTGLYGEPSLPLIIGSAWGTLQVVVWCSTAAWIALLLFLTYRLVTAFRWATIQLVVISIWTLALLGPVVDILALTLTTGIPASLLMEGVGIDILRSLVFSTVWTLYLLNSKRVANTYNKTGAADLAERFA